jgi:hypothetical protein
MTTEILEATKSKIEPDKWEESYDARPDKLCSKAWFN